MRAPGAVLDSCVRSTARLFRERSFAPAVPLFSEECFSIDSCQPAM